MSGRQVLSDDDEEMNEEEEEVAGDTVDLDERDGDEEEEEDDEEGQNEYEKDGFIVDEDEEEEDQNSDEERHKKKKKKRRESEKSFELDDDDYELLQDNNITGFRRPKPGNKFKRLKKAGRDADGEEQSGFSDEEEPGKFSKGGRTAEEKLSRRLFGEGGDRGAPLEDIAEEEDQIEEDIGGDMIGEDEVDEDEMADFIVDEEDMDDEGNVIRRTRRVKKKKLRRAPGVTSSALQEAHDIFGDPEDLINQRRSKRVNDQSDGKLEDEFEPFILSEKYMMPRDDCIRETDIPERIQMSEDITGPPPTDDKSIEEESVWICSQLSSGVNSPLLGMDDIVKEISKEDVNNVLTMMHVQKFEVPFIAMYRKELCTSLLKEPAAEEQDAGKAKIQWHKVLWAIHTLDRKWLLLQKRKSVLQLYYSKRFEEEARRIDDETILALNRQLFKSIDDALKDAKSEREVDDVDAKFNLHFPPGDVETDQGQFKRPKRKSLYNICYKAGLWEVANKFSINSEKFGLFLALEEVRQEDVEDAKETPEEIAANFTCQMFGTPEDVLKGARHMAAVEIGCEPNVRKYVRAYFVENAVVSTSPTPEGNTSIDSAHQLAGVKWLRNKPISEFKDAQWLLIQKAEEEKLLQVTIKLTEDAQKKLLADADEYYLSEGVSKSAQLWNEQRKMILKVSFFTYLIPSLEKEVRSLLQSRSKTWLLMEYGKQLWNKVSVAPYQRKEKDAENDDVDESGTRVLACCWGPGKPATTFVMLDSAGELVDLLHAGSLSVRSKSVAEQQRKKNDEQQVMKFVTDHQPQVVCLGGANLFCRQLKDELYEVFFKIVEDHPKEYSQDIHITILDESLSRLYENSRVSSDQLSGQSGIVKRAVGLGRYLQNPLAMVATLCGPGKEILSWKLCPLEHFLTPDEKYEVVEQVMVDATNQIGVDINLAASHEWLFAPLQFVSGLGPRKAAALQKTFVRSGAISTRKDIMMGKSVKKKVFINAAGFLRVRSTTANSSQYDILDDSRIHPESYELATNLAKDVCRENETEEDELEMAIDIIRERPETLEALDIDEYAKSKAEQSGTNKRETLYLIKMELLHNFHDMRAPFKDLDPDEEFTLLSGETEDTIAVGRVVQVTVRQIQENRIVCTFDTGLRAFISAQDYSEEGFNPETLQLRVGDMLSAEIKGIDKNRYLVYLTCNKKYRSRNQYIHKLDPYYHEERSVRYEQEKARKEKELAKKHFKPRMIVHPRFQNLTADEAMEYLSEKEAGESIIRPSSKGPSFLTLTLKVYDGVYAHKDIVETGKDDKDMTNRLRLGKKLTIDQETFEDLDELMDRYVDPLVSHLKTMLGYRKFRRGTKGEVDDLLKAEKADYPMRIVYCFGICHEHPGTFILSYIKTSTPHHEYIGLYPKGFRFRKKDFGDIDRLVAYFQKNIDKPPIDTLKSNAQLSAVVPIKSPGWGAVGGDSAGNNDGWNGRSNSDRERSSTPGSRTGNRYENRNNGGGRDNHPSGIPRPGRGRGRGNNGGNEADDSLVSPTWASGSKVDDGLSNFPGAKVQNSPGKEWFPGGGSGGSGAWGNPSSAGNDGGGWGNDSGAGRGDGGSGGWGNSSRDGNAGGGWGSGDTGGNVSGQNGGGGWGSRGDSDREGGNAGWRGRGGRDGGSFRGRGRGGGGRGSNYQGGSEDAGVGDWGDRSGRGRGRGRGGGGGWGGGTDGDGDGGSWSNGGDRGGRGRGRSRGGGGRWGGANDGDGGGWPSGGGRGGRGRGSGGRNGGGGGAGGYNAGGGGGGGNAGEGSGWGGENTNSWASGKDDAGAARDGGWGSGSSVAASPAADGGWANGDAATASPATGGGWGSGGATATASPAAPADGGWGSGGVTASPAAGGGWGS